MVFIVYVKNVETVKIKKGVKKWEMLKRVKSAARLWTKRASSI